jgi:hypothetical protein
MSNKNSIQYLIDEMQDDQLVRAKTTAEWVEVFRKSKEMYDQECKNLIVGTYMDIKMKNHKLPYGFEYFNKLAKVEADAEKFYKKVWGIIYSGSLTV